MGCAASRASDDSTVRRCRDRRRLIKSAVESRHRLAVAHSDYLRSLLSTASALSTFASFQSLSASDPTPTTETRYNRSTAATSPSWNREKFPNRFEDEDDESGMEEEEEEEEEEVGSRATGFSAKSDVFEGSKRFTVGRYRDLSEIAAAIGENFEKAVASGEGVSDMLEIGREKLDRSFRQLQKILYHSSGLMNRLASTWRSRPPLAVKYQLDPSALADSGGGKSLCSTMERLLAWENKLYQEVKARERVKIKLQRKLSVLQSQECKGKDDTKIDKTKVSIQKLQSLILVTSEAVSTTSSAIVRVRDDELSPQLIELCHRFMNVWKSMNQFHETQNHIVQQVGGLVNSAHSFMPTTDLHRQATRDLEIAISNWHSSFTRIVKFNRDYIRALQAWLKLTLLSVTNNDSEKDHSSIISSKLCAFCDEWRNALDQLPDTVAAEAIKSLVHVIHSISSKQDEEFKIKKRVESYSKELQKKSHTLQNIENKFYRSYSTVGIGVPNNSDTHGQVLDTRDPLAEKRSEIIAWQNKLEDEVSRHRKAVEAVREMTLNNIQTGLPGVFQAMTGFSAMISEALEGVCRQVQSNQL